MSIKTMRTICRTAVLFPLVRSFRGRTLLSLPFLFLPASPLFAPPDRVPAFESPGTIFVCGGGKLPSSVRDQFIELAGGPKARIVVIPTASRSADTAEAERFLKPWRSRKVGSVTLLHTRSRRQANDPAFLKPLTEATAVWISGGDQRLLKEAYLGTAVLEEIKKVLDRGGVVGGTSAGAAVMSKVMIAGGQQRAELDEGFGLLSRVIVDQHFRQRKRDRRLLAAIAKHPDLVGLGVDEETAVVIRGGTMKVLGNHGAVTCLAPLGDAPASVQVLEEGDQADLISLVQAAVARAQPEGANTER